MPSREIAQALTSFCKFKVPRVAAIAIGVRARTCPPELTNKILVLIDSLLPSP